MSLDHRVLRVSLPLLLSILGCAPDGAPPGGPTGPWSEESGGGLVPRRALDPKEPPRRALAATDDGALALISGDSGAWLAASAPGDREVRSIAFDPAAGLVLASVFDDIDAGELVGLPIAGDPPAFGDPIPLAGIDGDLRLLGAPSGVVIFAQSFPSWGWSWSGAASSASAPLPPPVSAWIAGGAPPGAVRIETLTLGDPGALAPVATRQAAIVSSQGIAVEPPEPLDPSIEDPAASRLVAAPAVGDVLLVGVEGGVLVVRRIDGALTGAPIAVPGAPTATRLEAVIALAGGRVLVAATNGPARLVAIAIDEAGAPVASTATDLPGGFAVADRFFSSDLLAIADDRVLVATGTGVLAVDVAASGSTIALTLDPAFDGAALRGPLAPSP